MESSKDFDKLPRDYDTATKECRRIQLSSFSLNELIVESMKCNPRAQRAVLVKIELEDCSVINQIDLIISFWLKIKDINANSNQFGLVWEYSITSSIKEVVFGERLYDSTKDLPVYSLVQYAIQKMYECDMEGQWLNKIVNYYNEELEFDKKYKKIN